MKPERNDPCPCGSGKKYKKCCGAAPPQRQPAEVDHFELARHAFTSGDFQSAQNACRVLLERQPENADFNHVCGLVSYRLQNLDEAKKRLAVAVQRMPGNAYVHSNLSLVLRDASDLDAAVASAHRAILLKPDLAEAHDNLATILKQKGDLAGAIDASGNAIGLNPANALFHANLAETLLLEKNLAAAESSYLRSLELAPNLPAALAGLGALRLQEKQWRDARAWLEKAVAAGSQDPVVFNSLGHALYELKDIKGASEACKQAVIRKPDFGVAHFNLGLTLKSLRQKSAVDAFAAALAYGHATWEVIDSLYRSAIQFGQIDRVYAHALDQFENPSLRPELLPAIIHLFGAACDFSARAHAWRRVQRLFADKQVGHETSRDLLIASLYQGDLDEKFIADLHRFAGNGIEVPLIPRRFADYRVSTKELPLRIGYLSPDLRKHSVAFFIQHVIANHDRENFEIYCYSLSREKDEDNVTEFIRQHSTVFRNVEPLDDESLARRIHEDGIHLLIDLGGHTEHTRPEVLAYRPAPLQITWIGYPANTGLASLDYRITDPYADDPTTNRGPEQLLTLPESFLCFGHFRDCEINPQPAMVRNGFATFASFNQLMKLTAETVLAWTRILTSVPDARLRIMAPTTDADAVRNNLRAEFAKHGIGAERVDLVPRVPSHMDYMRAHNDVDIMLDTWPYNGFTITANALWMGVPVVTLVGQGHRQRGTYSMLKNIGVEETITWDEEGYISAAVRLAQDPVRLTELRQRIARDIRSSILCDAPRFTRQVENLYRRVWDERAASVPRAADPN